MRQVDVSEITRAVKNLCIDANLYLGDDVIEAIENSINKENSKLCKSVLSQLLENAEIAKVRQIPICQDTGMAVIFIEVGQDVHFVGGNLTEAINKGVSDGYIEGFFRCSIVGDPILRQNTNDNTPAVIYTSIVPGDKVKILVAPKGFGSENMSGVKMFTPSATTDDIVKFVVETVKTAGSNPCPPVVVGVGIGGTFEYCAYLAKKALIRPLNIRNSEQLYSELEEKILCEVNKLHIGSQGFGGDVTALAVNIEKFATHIAGLPVAVNMGCHVTRHKEITL